MPETLGRLHIFRILRVFFAKLTTKYETLTIHFSHFMRISTYINEPMLTIRPSLWRHLKAEGYVTKPTNICELKAPIRETIWKIKPDTLHHIKKNFMKQM